MRVYAIFQPKFQYFQLDFVSFREDDCRIRKDNAPQNFAVLRHIAVNLLGKEKSQKLGTKSKRFCAGWDDEYLEKILECI